MTAQKVAAMDACLGHHLGKINEVMGRMAEAQRAILLSIFEMGACCPITLKTERSPSGMYSKDTISFHTEHGDFKYTVSSQGYGINESAIVKIPEMVLWFAKCQL